MATDYDCWRDSGDKVCVADVLAVFNKNVVKVTKLIVETVKLIGDSSNQELWDDQIDELKVEYYFINLLIANLSNLFKSQISSSIFHFQNLVAGGNMSTNK